MEQAPRLRLTGQSDTVTCPTCRGLGRIPCPPTIATRTGILGCNSRGGINQVSDGKPIPCPRCLGKKIIPGV